ncbi:T9SS response regulator signal transducer PorX [Marivirga arenosa]|uniref:Bifunctional response regulator/alkaline phosphatase family protein n=1 Tax=Marivirga arenosa TaxID=3059076 RepID=A0AA52F0Y7_9BACT|nr:MULTISPECIES: bifunctional response regulator/alkaline phosphatase family protein [unclassified Marivirga]WMN07250.1 bifunctional response regulator/alkaline phosphatase family protein [Marivirga sp. ABR2-2]WNB18548.1 bifunctional response regulator/alkaline phosphatase family protein [Marivirga sp. BKB1-2]
MQNYQILWADDEIDLLKPHIIFLENKGYQITPVNNGSEAVDLCKEQKFDIVFLDENMPGMTGLETLSLIKSNSPNLPVVMITKSEEEYIMEEAIGSKIADYLIKPLNPNQILLSVKKILDNQRLVAEKTNQSYQQDFRNISMAFGDDMDHAEWAEMYKKLVFWDLEIDQTDDHSMSEVLSMQHVEANTNFAKFIDDNYEYWLNEGQDEAPLLSHQLMEQKVFPQLGEEPVFFIVIDNLRFDQWKLIEPEISKYFNINEEDNYYSILPTTTAYARNSIFSGLLPDEMAKKHPDLWVNEDDDEGKNNFEDKFLERQLKQKNQDVKFTYNKIVNVNQGKQVLDQVSNMMDQELNVLVYNFVDMLSHARTDMKMIRELAPDESAYRSLTKSWFMHSPLLDLLKRVSSKKAKVIITTDHGTIRVKKPFKIVGDRNVNSNLRYKQGKNLGYKANNDVLEATKPERFHLPKINVSTSYVFTKGESFFAYPNNYNYYVNYFKDTFQHGGVSMEEMIIPIISLTSKDGK